MVLNKSILFFISVIILSSCTESVIDEAKSEPIPPDGKSLYILNCASCHGPDGKLGMSGAKDISQTFLTDEEIKSLVENGKNTMPSFKELLSKPGEIDAVIKHVATLKKNK